jgi:adenylate kinase family enzyme
VAVVGCSGSGKTTLDAALARALGVTHIELDSIYHQPGWTPPVGRGVSGRVTAATKPDTWVVDGNYTVVRDIIWERADTVVWFDLPYVKVMARTIRRTVRRSFT